MAQHVTQGGFPYKWEGYVKIGISPFDPRLIPCKETAASGSDGQERIATAYARGGDQTQDKG